MDKPYDFKANWNTTQVVHVSHDFSQKEDVCYCTTLEKKKVFMLPTT